jgi:hypothetical protein
MRLGDLTRRGRRAWPPGTVGPGGTGALQGVEPSERPDELVLVVEGVRHVLAWDPPPSLDRLASVLDSLMGGDVAEFGEIEIGAERLSDAELRAHVDRLLERGALRRTALAVPEFGVLAGECSVCAEPRPSIAYHYLDGGSARFHRYCEAVWKDRWHHSGRR